MGGIDPANLAARLPAARPGSSHSREGTERERTGVMAANSNIEWTETGRSLASNGYVLIRVGKDHPLADVRGYAYEHRLVASKTIGRWVLPCEQVHHRNEIKTDNRPENLEVLASLAEHRFRHRKSASNRRKPGEPNPELRCECGCGATFYKFDSCGRPRTFVSGHNRQPTGELAEMVLWYLENVPEPRNSPYMASFFGVPQPSLAATLSRLKSKDKVELQGQTWSVRG
jgi:hypothetical protein